MTPTDIYDTTAGAAGTESDDTVRKTALKDLNLEELVRFFENAGEKKFRAAQLFRRMYVDGAAGFDEVTEFSGALRKKLAQTASMESVRMLRKQESADGTKKYLFEVAGGLAVESVFMKYKYGNTACISSQAGCRMGCVFCASGISGLERDLTAGEILDQIVAMQRDSGERIGHVVFMGTGEPFDNYAEVVRAIEIMHDPRGLNIGLRGITVSTCGILNRMYDFAQDMPQVNLAVSLHAPNDSLRRELMPVARSYEMQDLMKACRRHTELTHRRLTFEYALMENKNDSAAHALELAELLRGMLCHVNLIPLNHVEERGIRGSDRRKAQIFADTLTSKGIEVTIRRELGSDISAACGQLRLEENNR